MKQIWGCSPGSEFRCLDTLADLRGDGVIAIGWRDTAVGPQELQDGQIGRTAAIGETVPFQIRRARMHASELLTKLYEEAGLADTGLADNPHRVSPSAERLREARV
jgi:hypothetical protein